MNFRLINFHWSLSCRRISRSRRKMMINENIIYNFTHLSSYGSSVISSLTNKTKTTANKPISSTSNTLFSARAKVIPKKSVQRSCVILQNGTVLPWNALLTLKKISRMLICWITVRSDLSSLRKWTSYEKRSWGHVHRSR